MKIKKRISEKKKEKRKERKKEINAIKKDRI